MWARQLAEKVESSTRGLVVAEAGEVKVPVEQPLRAFPPPRGRPKWAVSLDEVVRRSGHGAHAQEIRFVLHPLL